MNREVFITCAVTGVGDTAGGSEHVPVAPEAIAAAAIEAAQAAAEALLIACDPDTGAWGSWTDVERAAVERA